MCMCMICLKEDLQPGLIQNILRIEQRKEDRSTSTFTCLLAQSCLSSFTRRCCACFFPLPFLLNAAHTDPQKPKASEMAYL